MPTTGDLSAWARQGVLLLNATLTVTQGRPNTHEQCGWQRFTSAVVEVVNKRKHNVVFLLWGEFAKTKGGNVDTVIHKVLPAAHPRAKHGFEYTGPFSQTNAYLVSHDSKPIDWQIP
jgi:uracil-DNA glycosylase